MATIDFDDMKPIKFAFSDGVKVSFEPYENKQGEIKSYSLSSNDSTYFDRYYDYLIKNKFFRPSWGKGALWLISLKHLAKLNTETLAVIQAMKSGEVKPLSKEEVDVKKKEASERRKKRITTTKTSTLGALLPEVAIPKDCKVVISVEFIDAKSQKTIQNFTIQKQF